jgi:hypothetical protein
MQKEEPAKFITLGDTGNSSHAGSNPDLSNKTPK